MRMRRAGSVLDSCAAGRLLRATATGSMRTDGRAEAARRYCCRTLSSIQDNVLHADLHDVPQRQRSAARIAIRRQTSPTPCWSTHLVWRRLECCAWSPGNPDASTWSRRLKAPPRSAGACRSTDRRSVREAIAAIRQWIAAEPASATRRHVHADPVEAGVSDGRHRAGRCERARS